MKEVVINNYKFFRKSIGKGSFSKIYKAINKHDEIVAIKIIKKKNIKNEKLIHREINVLQSLKHENIISLLDVFTTNNHYYLIFQYCQYGDLKNYIYYQNPNMNEKEIQNIMIQLKNGLNYLHKHNIVHRDLKPQNILVTNDIKVKISDFGFAKIYKDNVMNQTICGSPLYMAPEILTYKKYTELADLWSVGVILYEIIFKKTPVNGNNLYMLVENIRDYKFDVSKLKSNVQLNLSKELLDLLDKLLKKNPKHRINWMNFFNHQWFTVKLNINLNNSCDQFNDTIFMMDEDNDLQSDAPDKNYSVIMNSENKLNITNNYLDNYMSSMDESDENYILVRKKNISTIPRSMPKNRFTDLITSLRTSLSTLFTSPNSI